MLLGARPGYGGLCLAALRQQETLASGRSCGSLVFLLAEIHVRELKPRHLKPSRSQEKLAHGGARIHVLETE